MLNANTKEEGIVNNPLQAFFLLNLQRKINVCIDIHYTYYLT